MRLFTQEQINHQDINPAFARHNPCPKKHTPLSTLFSADHFIIIILILLILMENKEPPK